MKVLIAVPALDMCPTDFAMSLAAMLINRAYDKRLARDIPIALFCAKGSLIAHARNLCVYEARKQGATHILFLDSDMVFPPDTLNRLASHHLDIIGADYVNRVEPHRLNGIPAPHAPSAHSNSPVPMMTLPFGCILIKLSVFDALDPSVPPFRYIEGLNDTDTMSEDTYLCNEARKAGFTIWMDPTLTRQLGHIGTRIYRHTDTQRSPA